MPRFTEYYFGNRSCVLTVLLTFLIGPFSLIVCCCPVDKVELQPVTHVHHPAPVVSEPENCECKTSEVVIEQV